MEVKVYLSSHFKESCPEEKIASIAADFKAYKISGRRPDYFGRDVPFEFPNSALQAELQHIHLKDSSSRSWNLKSISYGKTSNTALIYCTGFFDRNKYLLLGFLENAHETYTNNRHYLPGLADIAEDFRSRF
ncbi:type II toxin-antitoxin system YafO family toxin [Endozoicomonas numazuensis]|uniref:Toxin YafO n=1 Tax=Endozoicomonas numazuensis TaxID=1137799 RepID=A0A081NGB1_9GAMM|nr:type II toxin-antitoxin system YafO family toxin [Endozoicomonas numazuensis]KEQ17484.1 hypothetical protein GZ78_17120 [Endozoicomonas numazuensis]